MTTSDQASELVARYGPQINKVLFQHYIPRHAWPDVKQELRIRFFRSISSGKLHDFSEPFSYVYTCTLYEASHWLRKEHRHRRLELPERSEHVDYAEDIDRAARHRRLHAAIEKLPPLHRRIIEHQLQGGSLRDIADDTGYAHGTIKRRAFDARAILRDLLQ